MTTERYQDPDGSVTLLTRDAAAKILEELKLDPQGHVASKTVYRYDELNKLQEYTLYSQPGDVIKQVALSYGPGPWDAQMLEFDADHELQRRVEFSYDVEHKCKVRLFFDASGGYLGRALEKRDEDGVFRGLKYYDKKGTRIEYEPK